MVAAGRTTKEAAAALRVTTSTVEWHISNILMKLEASSRAEAVAIAVREGLLPQASDTSTARSVRRRPVQGLRARRRQERDLIDVLDRVLDKGIVIYAHSDISVGGIRLVTMEARVVVTSIATYMRYAQGVPGPPGVAASDAGSGSDDASGVFPSEAVTSAVEEYLRRLRLESGSEG